MTGTILAQSNNSTSPRPKTLFLTAAATLLLTLTGCAAEEFADEELAACKKGEIMPVRPNTLSGISPDIDLNCSGVYETERGLTSQVHVMITGAEDYSAELAVGESFTVENIGKFTLIRSREEPNLPFFLSSSDSVGICFEPAPDFTYEP